MGFQQWIENIVVVESVDAKPMETQGQLFIQKKIHT